jgi:glycosyltransferase involved in cell wall biosynthesis
VHLHGGDLTPALAFLPALQNTTVVTTCYASTRFPPRGSRREHRENASLARAIAAHAGGSAVARRALRSGRVAAVCTADATVAAGFARAGRVEMIRGAAHVGARQASWSDDPVVVFAGRAQSGRGVDDLIASFGLVRASMPGARLRLLLLPGGAAERWRASLAGAEWADVRVGPVPDLTGALAQCQVAAFPFRWPVTLTPALAAAEAMAVGLPLVATDVSCLAPLIEPGRNGALVPVGDPHALSAALVALLRGPDAWQPCSEGARKTIEQQWSWADAAAATEALYADLRRRA